MMFYQMIYGNTPWIG